MEIIAEFVTAHSDIFYMLLGGLIVAFIWWLLPAKKPKSRGTLYIMHYPNDFKELYLKLEDDIPNFEHETMACFYIENEDRTK